MLRLLPTLFLAFPLALSAFPPGLSGQSTSRVAMVRDAATGEPVPYGALRLTCAEERVDLTTDAEGLAMLLLTAASCEVVVSALSYERLRATVERDDGASVVELLLRPTPVELDEVIAGSTARLGARLATPSLGRLTLDSLFLSGVGPRPVEPDVLRSLVFLPSFSNSSEWSALPLYRNTPSDQVHLSLDGATIFNPFNFGGFLSVFHEPAVAGVDLYSPAQPMVGSNRMGGAIAVRTRDGRRDRSHLDTRIGLLTSSLLAEGPLESGKASYLISARTMYLSTVSRLGRRLGLLSDVYPHGFRDLHVKWTRDLAGGRRLSLAGFANRESIDGEGLGLTGDTDVLGWGNDILVLSFHTPIRRALVTLRAGVTRFEGDFILGNDNELSAGLLNQEAFVGLETGLQVGPTHWGPYARWRALAFDYDIDVSDASGVSRYLPSLSSATNAQEADAGLRVRWLAGPLEVRGSASALWERSGGRSAPSGSLLARVQATDAIAITASVADNAQFIRSLRNEESLFASYLSYNLLDMLPDSLPESRLRHAEVGVGAEVRGVAVNGAVYLRRSKYLLPRLGADPLDGPAIALPGDLVSATERAWGVELSAFGTTASGTSGALAYSYRRSKPSVDGDAYRPRTDRPHTMDGTLSLGALGGRASMRASIASGRPRTAWLGVLPRIGVDDQGRLAPDRRPSETLVLGEYNADRLPASIRLDLGYERSWSVGWMGRSGEASLSLSVVNALNRSNPLSAELTRGAVYRTTQFLELPVLPSIAFRWRH